MVLLDIEGPVLLSNADLEAEPAALVLLEVESNDFFGEFKLFAVNLSTLAKVSRVIFVREFSLFILILCSLSRRSNDILDFSSKL